MLTREDALKCVIEQLNERDIVVGTTGMLSRELFELRELRKQGHEKDFLTVGSMGHSSSIAMGIAMFKPKRNVYCLDGDGATIMHMGSLSTIGQNGSSNLKHILFNNGAHDSVGGQPTDAGNESFSFRKIALGCGYKEALCAETVDEIKSAIDRIQSLSGPVFLEIRCNPGHRKNLGRPTRKPIENKSDFMHFLAIN